MRPISRRLGVAWDLLAALELRGAECEADHLGEPLDACRGTQGAPIVSRVIPSRGGVATDVARGEQRMLSGQEDRPRIRRRIAPEDRADDPIDLAGARGGHERTVF